jgi:hypothetical protein
MRTDGRTDVAKLIGAFGDIAHTPKNVMYSMEVCKGLNIVLYVWLSIQR